MKNFMFFLILVISFSCCGMELPRYVPTLKNICKATIEKFRYEDIQKFGIALPDDLIKELSLKFQKKKSLYCLAAITPDHKVALYDQVCDSNYFLMLRTYNKYMKFKIDIEEFNYGAISISSDCKYIATTETDDDKNYIAIYRLNKKRSYEPIRRLSTKTYDSKTFLGLKKLIAYDSDFLNMYDVKTLKLLRRLDTSKMKIYGKCVALPKSRSIAFTASCSESTLTDHKICVWDTISNSIIKEIINHQVQEGIGGSGYRIYHVASNAQENLLISIIAYGYHALVWDITKPAGKECVADLEHPEWIFSVALNPSGSYAITGAKENVYLWDIFSKTLLKCSAITQWHIHNLWWATDNSSIIAKDGIFDVYQDIITPKLLVEIEEINKQNNNDSADNISKRLCN